MPSIISVSLLILSFFIFCPAAEAKFSFKISDVSPEKVTQTDRKVKVTLEVDDLPSGISYFRAAFTKDKSYPRYFGEIQDNEGQWVEVGSLSNSDCSEYFEVEGDDDWVELELWLRMPEDREAGDYFIRAHRFTSSCSSNSPSDNFWVISYKKKVSPSPTPTASLTPTPTDVPSPTIDPTDTPVPSPFPKDYDNIYISEVMPNPEQGNEWVELYNDNEFEVDLAGWFIDDEPEGSSPKKLDLKLSLKDYEVFELKTNDFIFNNSGDEVRLLNFDQEVKDKFEYPETEKGISWALVENDWCLAEPSYEKQNPHCRQEEQESPPSPTLSPTEISTPTPSPTITLSPSPSPSPSPTGGADSQFWDSELGVFNTESTRSGEVLGESTPPKKNNKNKFIALGLITIGGGFISTVGAWPYLKNLFATMKKDED